MGQVAHAREARECGHHFLLHRMIEAFVSVRGDVPMFG
jgi:hypothetical protein